MGNSSFPEEGRVRGRGRKNLWKKNEPNTHSLFSFFHFVFFLLPRLSLLLSGSSTLRERLKNAMREPCSGGTVLQFEQLQVSKKEKEQASSIVRC